MYAIYEDFLNSYQTQWDESQKFWQKETERWQQMSQNYLDDLFSQVKTPFDQNWYSHAVKDCGTFWEKSLEMLGPWYPICACSAQGNAHIPEISGELDEVRHLQSEHKKKVTELTRQLTLLKKDMTAQKQLAKSQAVEIEAIKDNLGLQEKTIAAIETRLKAAQKSKNTK